MGYRSDVLIAFGTPDKDELAALFVAARLMPWYADGLPNEFNKGGEISNYKYVEVKYTQFKTIDAPEGSDKPTYVVRTDNVPYHIAFAMFESVKWYESYPDVIWHEELRKMAEHRGLETMFIRIGEEDDDNVSEHSDGVHEEYILQEHFTLQRKVEIDLGEPVQPVTDFLGKKENNNASE